MNKQIITIKKANLSDGKLLLRIHNSAVTGGYVKSKKLVKFNEHIVWFKNKLKSKKSQIYIGKKNKIKFGFVRFDEVKKNIYEISLGNLLTFYGKGLGSIMLGKCLKKFIKKFKPKKIISVVLKFNVRSQKCFLKNGFIKIDFNPKDVIDTKYNILEGITSKQKVRKPSSISEILRKEEIC